MISKNIWKKGIAISLISMLSLTSLLSGCTKESKEKDDVVEVEDDAVVVSSLEEFLEAIEPGANIVFKKGTYDFTPDLEDLYGKDGRKFNKDHDYVRLEECYDGLQFVIYDVDGLTISGQDGKYVELQVEPRYADVLSFENCSDISINNMTIGHTIEQGSCEGDVLQFNECENIVLTSLDLYGCGTYGICAYETDDIDMSDSIIRDCSYGIMDLSSSSAVFTDCEFTGCEGFDMLELSGTDATFSKCSFKDNDLSNGNFITCWSNERGTIEFKKCSFGVAESRAIDSEESGYSNVSFDSKCLFEDIEGAGINNAKAFLEAIEPYAGISIEPGYYNLTEFINSIDINEWNRTHEYVQIDEVYDGYSVRITGVHGMDIHSSTYNPGDVEIVVEPRYAEVLKFENCAELNIEGITMGHTDTGECSGSVLCFEYCSSYSIKSMDLYGCGVYGIETYCSGDMYVEDTIIRECSYGPFDLAAITAPISFENCDMYSSNGAGNISPSRYDVEFINCDFGEYESSINYSHFARFDSCNFENEQFHYSENFIGGHKDIDGLSEISYTKYCNNYYDYEDTFWYGFEFEKKKKSELLPYYENDTDCISSVLGIFPDGTGYVKGLPGDDIIFFTWSEDEDSKTLIIEEDGSDIFGGEGRIKFYDDSEGYNVYTEVEFGDTTVWYIKM